MKNDCIFFDMTPPIKLWSERYKERHLTRKKRNMTRDQCVPCASSMHFCMLSLFATELNRYTPQRKESFFIVQNETHFTKWNKHSVQKKISQMHQFII